MYGMCCEGEMDKHDKRLSTILPRDEGAKTVKPEAQSEKGEYQRQRAYDQTNLVDLTDKYHQRLWGMQRGNGARPKQSLASRM